VLDMTTEAQPRHRVLTPGQLIVVIVALLAAAASVVGLFAVVPSALKASEPERPVRAYLQAIVDGHLSKAIKLGGIKVGSDDKLLTTAAYDQASDRVTSFDVFATNLDGSSGTVGVRIHQRDDSYTMTFKVERAPGFSPFPQWKLEPQTLPTVEFALSAAIDAPISISKVDFSTHKGVVTQHVFPGTYEGQYAGDITNFGGTYAWATVEFTTSAPHPEEIGLELQDKGKANAATAVASWVSKCATSSELHPPGCPFRAIPDPGISYSNGRWALQSQPRLEESAWSAELGGWPLTTASPGYISYTADAAQGGLTGTATTGSKPFSVAGAIVPDAGGGIRFVPSAVYSSDSDAVPGI
jgi:hypothetical protein